MEQREAAEAHAENLCHDGIVAQGQGVAPMLKPRLRVRPDLLETLAEGGLREAGKADHCQQRERAQTPRGGASRTPWMRTCRRECQQADTASNGHGDRRPSRLGSQQGIEG